VSLDPEVSLPHALPPPPPPLPSADGGPAAPAAASGRRRWEFWRSPEGQPPWARPALLGIAAVAALLYARNLAGAGLAPFYSVAVKRWDRDVLALVPGRELGGVATAGGGGRGAGLGLLPVVWVPRVPALGAAGGDRLGCGGGRDHGGGAAVAAGPGRRRGGGAGRRGRGHAGGAEPGGGIPNGLGERGTGERGGFGGAGGFAGARGPGGGSGLGGGIFGSTA
jgi:hypothetical protein